MSLPGWIRAFVRSAVPREFAEDLIDDLEEGLARRKAEGDGAAGWLAGELLRTPYLRMWRQARRMRAAGTRRESPVPRTGGTMGGAGRGIRIAVRSLLRRPSYAAVAVLTMVASIGSATLIFSVLEGVLLRPLPYEGGERVHRIFATNREWREADQEVLRANWDRLDLTQDMISALRGSIPGAEAMGAYTRATVRVDDDRPPERIPGAWVLPGFFETLPMDPALGRVPDPGEMESGAPLVVISQRLWASRYGSDPEILGRTISLGGDAHTVVGVLPGTFAVPSRLTRWWSPVPPDFAGGRTDAAVFAGLVRLAPEADRSLAVEGVRRVASSLAESNPTYASMGVRIQSLSELVVASVRDGLELLFAAVAVIVLIAAVNLANLLVARGARRRGELAMRSALGAGRIDLVWSLLSESLVVCVVGGGLGVLVATQLLDPFLALLTRASPSFPRADSVRVSGTVLLFSTGVVVLTVILSGLLPALTGSRRSPWEALQTGRRTRGGQGADRTQRGLLLTEAALAMVLLTAAGLLTRSALHVASLDPGYDARTLAYVGVETSSEGRYGSPAAARALGERLEERMLRLPGTESVARASSLPGLGGADGKLFWPAEGSMEDGTLTWTTSVSPGYFRAMGIPLLSGRTFSRRDGPDDPPVAVVSELFAQRFLGGEDPVGGTVMMGTDVRMEGGRVVAEGSREVTVVGVVDDVRQLTVLMEPDPAVYLPMTQGGAADPRLVIRTGGSPEEVLPAARAQVQAEDPELLVTEADVLHRSMRRVLGPLEVRWILILSLAGLAAFLTVVGIYGVVAYTVSDRRHEIGVRMALGARSSGESWRMVRRALVPTLLGALLGIGGAYAASGLLEDALYGVESLDPVTYAVVLALLAASAAAGAWLPARRAASVDPMRVLNEE